MEIFGNTASFGFEKILFVRCNLGIWDVSWLIHRFVCDISTLYYLLINQFFYPLKIQIVDILCASIGGSISICLCVISHLESIFIQWNAYGRFLPTSHIHLLHHLPNYATYIKLTTWGRWINMLESDVSLDLRYKISGGFNNLFSKLQLYSFLSFTTNDDDDDGEVEGDHDY